MTNIYSSGASGDGKVLVNSGASTLYGVLCDNLSGATRFLQVFNATSEPSTGTAPVIQLRLSASQQSSLSFTRLIDDLVFTTGLYVASSTTSGSYTAGGANDFSITIFWTK